MATTSHLTVIFDGSCGFCTRTVRLLRRRDREARITWVPCQQLTGDKDVRTLCMDTVVSITGEGVMETGAQAFARILVTLSGSRWPVRISSLPIVSVVLSLGYRLIARLRSHLPGDVPWCEQHPEDCQPEDDTG